MKEININIMKIWNEEPAEKLYSIPDEGCCSYEFTEGCILLDGNDD